MFHACDSAAPCTEFIYCVYHKATSIQIALPKINPLKNPQNLPSQMCPILLTILVSGGATMTRFVTPEGLMVGYRYLSPGSEEVLYLFANKTSLPPDVSGRSDMVWYEQNVDPKTGLTTSEARVTPAVDYRASEPYRKATETDGADWGLVVRLRAQSARVLY